MTSTSNNQGRPKIILPASMVMASHQISLWVPSMWRGTLQRSLIDNEVESIQDTLYGRGCGTTLSPVQVIVFWEIALMLLPLSTNTLQNLLLIWIRNCRMVVLRQSSACWGRDRAHLTTDKWCQWLGSPSWPWMMFKWSWPSSSEQSPSKIFSPSTSPISFST